MVKSYRPKKGSRLTNEQAQRYGDEISTFSKGKNISAFDVVESAKGKDSPLHDYFDWDNDVAGDKWRLEQAQCMIRSIEVKYIGGDGKPEYIRMMYNLETEENKNMYIPVDEVFSSEIYREQLLERAYSEAISWKERYHHLQEFSKVFESIERLKM